MNLKAARQKAHIFHDSAYIKRPGKADAWRQEVDEWPPAGSVDLSVFRVAFVACQLSLSKAVTEREKESGKHANSCPSCAPDPGPGFALGSRWVGSLPPSPVV